MTDFCQEEISSIETVFKGKGNLCYQKQSKLTQI